MPDFARAGAGVAVCGALFHACGGRLWPRGRKPQPSPEAQFSIEHYTAEARLPADSPMVGRIVGDLEALGDGELSVAAIIRENSRRYVPTAGWTLFENDILVLESVPHVLNSVIERSNLELVGSKELPKETQLPDNLANVEAVITADSIMVGATPAQLHLRDRYGVNLLAMSRQGPRAPARLRPVRFKGGDVVRLAGGAQSDPRPLARAGRPPPP